MKIKIERNSDDGVETKGTMTVFDENNKLIFTCFTLERPFLGNQHEISCIPIGTYNWQKSPPTHIPYEHISILNVPDREGIAVHRANYVQQLAGCCAVGDGYEDINGDGTTDIINSKLTFDRLMSLLPDKGTLTIYPVLPITLENQ